ncbi:sarcosine oxidase subunit gamma [Ensifer canadensis]|jgi:heterotetrameric sarcosine oxidase gamma subunit
MVRDYNNRHALDQKLRGTPKPAHVDHLEVGHWQAIATVLAHAGLDAAVQRALSSTPDLSLRYCGPGEWLVVSGVDTPVGLMRRLDMLCGTQAHVIDQSDGRVLLRLSGPSARQILAKGIGVDLHPAAFALGGSTNVLCGHIAINLSRTGEDIFELIVSRSFAESLFEDLMTMGRPFDLSAAFSE